MSDTPQGGRIRSRQPAPATQAEETGGTETPETAAAPTRNRAPAQGGGWMKRGGDADTVYDAEKTRNEEKERKRAEGLWMPWRFWVSVGKQTEVVVLDEEPGPCFYEHHMQDPNTGKWDIYESCPKEFEACPLCDGQAGGKESYYVMMLTVIVLDPYIDKNGKTVEYSKKLLAVKTNDQGFFRRLYERQGTLRGSRLLMARSNKQDSRIGRPELVELHGEADVMASFGHGEIKASDGRVIKKENADCYPFPYEKLFTRPSGEDLRSRYGGTAPMGSRGDIEGGSKITPGGGTSSSYDDLDDSIPF